MRQTIILIIQTFHRRSSMHSIIYDFVCTGPARGLRRIRPLQGSCPVIRYRREESCRLATIAGSQVLQAFIMVTQFVIREAVGRECKYSSTSLPPFLQVKQLAEPVRRTIWLLQFSTLLTTYPWLPGLQLYVQYTLVSAYYSAANSRLQIKYTLNAFY